MPCRACWTTSSGLSWRNAACSCSISASETLGSVMCVLTVCAQPKPRSVCPNVLKGCSEEVRGKSVEICAPEGATSTGVAGEAGAEAGDAAGVDDFDDRSLARPVLPDAPDAPVALFSRFACSFCCSLDSFLGAAATPWVGDAVLSERRGLAALSANGLGAGVRCKRGALALVPTSVNPSSVSGLLAARRAACLTCKDTYLHVYGPGLLPAPWPP